MRINWKAAIIKLILAACGFMVLTYVPAVEQFLATDRLLLLNAIELGCAGTFIWQIWKFLASKFYLQKGL